MNNHYPESVLALDGYYRFCGAPVNRRVNGDRQYHIRRPWPSSGRLFVMLVGLLWFGALVSRAATYYVATNGTGDGSSWANATNSLQGAIIKAVASDTVLVSNGVYDTGGMTNYPAGRNAMLTNRIVIDKAIMVRSANNDPTNTIIKGAWASSGTTNGPDAVRCVYMVAGSSLIGFTLTNGATLKTGDSDTDKSGGGVYSYYTTSPIISNCVIAGNASEPFGGGGGAYYGTLYNCMIVNNGGGYAGGGACNANLYNCTLRGNSVSGEGGGFQGISCILSNCTLIGNSSGNVGGGARYGNLYNCTLISNVAVGSGGGMATYVNRGDLYNCTLIGNSSGNNGGGVEGGAGGVSTQYNCTFIGNSATNAGGGVYAATLYNCISWGNSKVDSAVTAYYSRGADYTNGGSVFGNITNDPQFVNSAAGNYRLSANSPCINTGTNQSWWMTGAVDLDGRTRIRYGTVDMGAYEFIRSGTIYSSH